jgi:hypothetical protein
MASRDAGCNRYRTSWGLGPFDSVIVSVIAWLIRGYAIARYNHREHEGEDHMYCSIALRSVGRIESKNILIRIYPRRCAKRVSG